MDGSSVAVKKCEPYDPTDPANGQKQIYVQLVLSLALGVSAFLGFCVRLSGPLHERVIQAEKEMQKARRKVLIGQLVLICG